MSDMCNKTVLKHCLAMVFTILTLVAMSGCSDSKDEDEPDRPAQYVIEGKSPIGNEFTTYTVTGVPSGASVRWSVSDTRFVLSQNGYNSTYIKATQSGVEATLTARIVRGDELVGWLTKAVVSEF